MTGCSVKIAATMASTRVFKGLTADERRAERRARLDEAALEVIGTRGWSQATMTEICRTAGLTERYFYESYRSRDDLYIALIDRLAAELRAAVLDALARAPAEPRERIRAAAGAVVGLLVGDPRKGRAALVEGLGSEALEQRRREIVAGFAELLELEREAFFGPGAVDPARRALSAAAIAGAVTHVLARRLDGTLDAADDELVAYLAEVGALLGLAAAP